MAHFITILPLADNPLTGLMLGGCLVLALVVILSLHSRQHRYPCWFNKNTTAVLFSFLPVSVSQHGEGNSYLHSRRRVCSLDALNVH